MTRTLQSKVAFRNPSFPLPSRFPSHSFSLVFLRNSLVFHSIKIILTFLLTPSPVRPMLSAVNQNLRQKLASLVFQAIAYAALGYAFYFLFFASQF